MNYPGDDADPKDVAKYFAWVAENEFQLPPILPVMTSCVEITQAWTGPGDVKDVPGYLSAVDHTSVGYFQQQNNWGTYAQRIDPEWSLRAFCKEAKRIEDDSPADTPQQLGAWCAAVQRPRKDLEYLYAEKGYPMAKKLLEEAGTTTEYPQRNIGFDKDGWALDLETNAWIRSDRKDTALYTNVDGWLWGKPVSGGSKPTEQWEWPEANVEPDPNSWNYQARHPTRYFWRPDVEAWARYLVDNYNVWCNTYLEHPEGYGYNVASTDADGTVWYVQNTSMDVWGPAGRNDPIDYEVGQEIFSLLFNDPDKPDINWAIWQRTIYGAWNNWQGEPFGDGSAFTNHEDHCHVTYV